MVVPETNARNKIKPRKYDVGKFFPGKVSYVEEGGCNIYKVDG